jgi:hypothetical protein
MSIDSVPRRGITLLEVLISIGILAIGLSSVVALIPAARSQASRAVVVDRAAVLAANALADAATFGVLLDGALTVHQNPGVTIIVDPAGVNSYQLPSASGAALRNTGVFSGLATGAAAPAACQRLLTVSRDDVLVTTSTGPGTTADDPPVNVFSDGARSYEGRMSCLYCLSPPALPGDLGRLSVVVFHGRDPSLPFINGTVTNFLATISSTVTGGRPVKEILKPGVVFWDSTTRRFHQAVAAAFMTGTNSALLTLSSGTLLSGTVPRAVQFLPDSVGLAERPYLPEAPGPFTR